MQLRDASPPKRDFHDRRNRSTTCPHTSHRAVAALVQPLSTATMGKLLRLEIYSMHSQVPPS